MPYKAFTLPRGMRDIDQIETAKREWLFGKIAYVAEKYGFQKVDPSPIEKLETLEAKSGPAIRDEIYCFKDKAGRDLGLRFDLTVGMTRMVASRRDLPQPIKLYAISGMWRYDEPQFARYRYFHQWDMEIYGSENTLADAETISASMDILEEIGLHDYEVLINSRVLMDSFLASLKISSEEQRMEALRLIDKIQKTPREKIVEEFERLGVAQDRLEKLLEFTSIKGPPEKILEELEAYEARGQLTMKGLDTVRSLVEDLKAYGKLSKCFLNMGVVRGIDYYDGIVFEAYDKGGEDVGAILGGGRYDRLGLIYGGSPLPATGVAGGVERLMISLERRGLLPKIDVSPKAYVTILNDQVKAQSIALAQLIRRMGVSCDLELKNRPLKKQLEYADSMGIPYTLILGPKEIEKDIVRIRDMKTRRETLVPTRSLEEWIKKIRS
ncbi:MAG: histidine--tRNA ligase [Candidatus Bathyarchaeia archaeon]